MHAGSCAEPFRPQHGWNLKTNPMWGNVGVRATTPVALTLLPRSHVGHVHEIFNVMKCTYFRAQWPIFTLNTVRFALPNTAQM
jgi:hypothetical protein